MRASSPLLLALVLTACTDPFARSWQSHGPELIGDFELFIEPDLTGRVDFLRRTPDGTLDRVDRSVEALLVDRVDGVWKYDVIIAEEPDLACELDRFTDELTCEWGDFDLDFDLYEEDDTTCKHDVCRVGRPLKASCNACTERVCMFDKFCCNNAWDTACRLRAINDCASMCGSE